MVMFQWTVELSDSVHFLGSVSSCSPMQQEVSLAHVYLCELYVYLVCFSPQSQTCVEKNSPFCCFCDKCLCIFCMHEFDVFLPSVAYLCGEKLAWILSV